ncbi:MAG: class I SAM-dependent methyltransferase [Thermoplasmatota archaeon]
MSVDDPRTLTLRDFAADAPRRALMWPPRAADIARLTRWLPPNATVIDVGAGSGLLARLVADARPDFALVAIDDGSRSPATGRFFPVEARGAESLAGPFDAALVSWMEAGRDLRPAVAALAPPVIVQASDVEGGCGVKGDVSFEPFGYHVVDRWTTPSFEDVDDAFRTRGRGELARLRVAARRNVVEVNAREERAPGRAAHVIDYVWEREMDALGL